MGRRSTLMPITPEGVGILREMILSRTPVLSIAERLGWPSRRRTTLYLHIARALGQSVSSYRQQVLRPQIQHALEEGYSIKSIEKRIGYGRESSYRMRKQWGLRKTHKRCKTCGVPVLIIKGSPRGTFCQECRILDGRKRARKWYAAHREKALAYARQLKPRLRSVLRSRLWSALRWHLGHRGPNVRKTSSAVRDLGCTIDKLKEHLESRFQPGMHWGNWGRGNGKWQIDHIQELHQFDMSDPKQQKAACHYTNLQPLWALDNLRKSIGLRNRPRKGP
jgi:hypothetical protein